MKPHSSKKRHSLTEEISSQFKSDKKSTKHKKSIPSDKIIIGLKDTINQTPRVSAPQKNSLSKNKQKQSTKIQNKPNQQTIYFLAQKTAEQLQTKQLQEQNLYYQQTVRKLQIQLYQKDLLLDQCQHQIAFLKQKFTELFSQYQISQKGNLNEENQIKNESQETMRRIQYSQDTLKLSQASSSIRQIQVNQNCSLKESSFDLSDSCVKQENYHPHSFRKSTSSVQRSPLKSIQNLNSLIRTKLSDQKIIFSQQKEDQNEKYAQNNLMVNKNDHMSDGTIKRKNSVSAITATHRLAAFYHKKIQ